MLVPVSRFVLPSLASAKPLLSWQSSLPRRNLLRSTQIRAMASGVESVVVYVTAPSKEEGSELATKIVTKQLAACVNQVPGVQSTYLWEGKINTDSEVLLIIKTRKALLDELTAFVTKEHSYDVPEVIALPILGGSPAYLKWIHDSTKAPG